MQAPNIKAILFDLDGTIGNTLVLCFAAFRKSIEPLAGKTLTDKEIIATFGPSEEGTIRALLPEKYEEGLAQYLYYYKEMHTMCPAPFEGIVPLIQWIKSQGVVVGLVTGKGEKSCDITLSCYGIEKIFDAIETGSPLGDRKREGMLSVLKQFDILPSSAVYIGDTVGDIIAARKAGIQIFSAAWAQTADYEALVAHKPDRVFRSVRELRRCLEELLATS